MDAQQPGTFDRSAFIAAVKTAIEAKSPKTLQEADDYRESGKAGEVAGEVKGLVTQGTQGQTKDVETATGAPPDQSTAVAKPVSPMAPEEPGVTARVPATGSAPKPAPNDQLNLAAGPRAADEELAGADVTEDQLSRSNEPEFTQAVSDKQAAAEQSAQAPTQYRRQESQVIQQTAAEANAESAGATADMQGSKAAALATIVADKGKAKTKDEAKRAEVTGRIQTIFGATESDVKKILDGIDAKVETAFATGEASARQAFEGYVSAKMSAYKKDRYGGWLGGLRWAKDKLVGMPDKVNEFYEAGRELYLKQMDGVISRVADIVGGDLTAAKQRIASGKAEIAAYVKSLPTDLQKVGNQASQEIGERFTDLEGEVDAKQESVVDTLATKYVEARKGLDERIEALQAENKGLVDKAIGAIKAVINTIRELASMLKNVLSRAAGVVSQIIKDPIGFLGNLIAGIKGGILKFKDNILSHLRRGLMGWLFGSLAEAGIELPDSFDLKGIIKLLASIFGLTWANIRSRIVKQIGEKAMGAVEKGVEIFSIFAAQGIGGLSQLLVEKLGDIKEMILEQVKDFVITKIITAGITWLIGLLNPAAAFIKACKLIYDVVMFFITNGSRIMAFVNTILDSVSEIVRGNVGAVVNKINDVLGQMIPLIIGFLASAIGLGGIGQKIREIITKLQKPVTAALDFVIKKGLQLAGPVIRGLKGIGSRVKAKVASGKAWVKGKVDSARDRVARGANGRTKPSEEVRNAALAAVRVRLGHVKTVTEGAGVLRNIEGELRGQGLRSLRFGRPNGTGALPVVATASPPKTIAKLAPWAAKLTKGAQVAALITIDYVKPPDLSKLNFGRRAVKDVGGRPVRDASGGIAMEPDDLAMAGGAFVSRPAAGSNQVQVLGTSGRALRDKKNTSHAEFHAAGVLGAGGQISGDVSKIHVKMKGYSPCPNCASSLMSAAAHIKQTSPSATFALDCSGCDLYRAGETGYFRTWQELRAAMPGWLVIEGKALATGAEPFHVTT
jgi:hypothetical protein